MSALNAAWSAVSDADHLAAFAALPEGDQAAHLTGAHQLDADQLCPCQSLVDMHAEQHGGRS